MLRSRGVNPEGFRTRLLKIVGEGEHAAPPGTRAPFSPRAKKVLELSLREALACGSNAVGPEHILLGIARESNSVAIRILQEGWGLSAKTLLESLPASPPGVAQARRPGPVVDPTVPVERSIAVRIYPSPAVRRLLMTAGASALDDGRTEIEIDDLWVALMREPTALRLAAQLGIDESAVREALARRRSEEPPPASATGSKP